MMYQKRDFDRRRGDNLLSNKEATHVRIHMGHLAGAFAAGTSLPDACHSVGLHLEEGHVEGPPSHGINENTATA